MLEAEVALLDEVEQLHARRQGIPTGDAHHQAEVGADEAVLGGGGGLHRPAQLRGGTLAVLHRDRGIAALLDDLRQLALLLCREEGHETDLVEVLAD